MRKRWRAILLLAFSLAPPRTGAATSLSMDSKGLMGDEGCRSANLRSRLHSMSPVVLVALTSADGRRV